MSGDRVRDVSEPAYVRRQYARETGLAARKWIYREVTGPDAREMAFDAVAEAAPLVGLTRWELPFRGENGADLLRRHFARSSAGTRTGR